MGGRCPRGTGDETSLPKPCSELLSGDQDHGMVAPAQSFGGCENLAGYHKRRADESLQKKLGDKASQYVEKNNSLDSVLLTEIHAYNQIVV